MASKSQSHLQEILTGIFVVAVVGLLIFFTVIISGVDLLHGRNAQSRQVIFEHIGTLKVQDPVYVRGMNVGRVQALELREEGVLVTLQMNTAVTLREDYQVTVGQTSMLGGSCLEIVEGKQGALLPEDTVLTGIPPKDIMKELGTLVSELSEAVDPVELKATFSNLRNATEDIATLTDRAERGEGLIGKLLSPEDKTYEDLQATMQNLRTVTDGVANGEGLIGKLLRADDGTYEDLKATVANARQISDKLNTGKGLLGQLLQEDTAAYQDLTATLANLRQITAKLNDPNSGLGRLLSTDTTLVTDLEATAANLKGVSEKLQRGEGTIGKLINDETVALEVEGLIKDVRQVIDNMRDTAPITTFSSLFFSGM